MQMIHETNNFQKAATLLSNEKAYLRDNRFSHGTYVPFRPAGDDHHVIRKVAPVTHKHDLNVPASYLCQG